MATVPPHLIADSARAIREDVLSPMQEGMLFHHLAGLGSGVDLEQLEGLREGLGQLLQLVNSRL